METEIKEENRHWLEDEETARQRVEQARTLKTQARTGGLKFEAYLPSGIAEWVLDMVEKGDFIDPCEAVFVFMKQAKDIDPYDDIKIEIIKKRVGEGIKDLEEGRVHDIDEVMERLKKDIGNGTKPAVWKKIPQKEAE